MTFLIRIEKALPDTGTMVGFVGKCWELVKVCADKTEAEKHIETKQSKHDKFIILTGEVV